MRLLFEPVDDRRPAQGEVQRDPRLRGAKACVEAGDVQSGLRFLCFRRGDGGSGAPLRTVRHVLHDTDALHCEIVARETAGVRARHRDIVETENQLRVRQASRGADRSLSGFHRGALRLDGRAVIGGALDRFRETQR
ncbi:MAG: hypothetical protein FD124_3476 [Alphaproteobacteria bacterium]|nr:MAG: hypothetical protein FD124_3476 [Alphaproteobacteria bacterium]